MNEKRRREIRSEYERAKAELAIVDEKRDAVAGLIRSYEILLRHAKASEGSGGDAT